VEDRSDLARLKGGIAGLKFFVDEQRRNHERLDEKVDQLLARVATLEGRHTDLREDITANHRLPAISAKPVKSDPERHSMKPERKPSEALETLKTIGPWILGGFSLLGTIVNAIVQALTAGQ
jgi:hypothetical protein